jgi:2-polyprenyl-3-methyl-5-hydroxy-6-metoxy-1,4-benzoquinol methylase
MIDSSKVFEKLLQNFRFNRVKNLLIGDVLDFGGNEGELNQLVKGNYTIVNYDHSPMDGKQFDTIVLLAVIEHIEVSDVHLIFNKFSKHLKKSGKILLTTPTPKSKWILELLASIGILDKQNIEEHKHYWDEKDIMDLANKNGFQLIEYKKFQIGFNQFAIMSHKD